MPLRIFGDWLSQPTRAVIWLALLGDVPHEVVQVRIAALEHRSEEFAKINPNRQVPALQEEDGFCLSESGAILSYLASKTVKAQSWYPTDPRARARIDQVLHWYHGNLRKGAATYIFSKAFAKTLGIEVPEAIVEEARRTMRKSLKRMDAWLAEGAYLAGPSPTVADLLCACELEQAQAIEYDFAEFPHVQAWRERMRGVPHFHAVHSTLEKLAPRFRARL